MKKIFIMAVWVVLLATPAMAVSVVGSKHDMIASGFATGGGNTEVCVFCHTPHSAQSNVTQAPLWNNTAVATGVIALGDLYVGQDINFSYTTASVDATDARLCLACHGSAGVGMPVNQPSSGTFAQGVAMGANTLIDTNLSNDHPIGMDVGATPEFNPSSAVASGLRTLAAIRGGGTGFGEDPFFGGDPDTPDNINIMWCSTCHNVHNNDNAPFLRKSNVASALCKACHIK